MILAIDTSTIKTGIALYSPNGRSFIKQWTFFKAQSEELLVEIDKLLKQAKLKLSDLKAIAVFRGPGSYTGLRVGIATANALAWALNIPVVGIVSEKTKNQRFEKFSEKPQMSPLEIAQKAALELNTKRLRHFSKIVLPYYPK